jgi:electron transfer flavoprotein beta subunit
VDVAGGKVTVEQVYEGGQETVTAPLPVVISVAKEINSPRYPSFMGIRKASRAKIPTLAAGDLAVAPSRTVTWENLRKPEEQKSVVQIFDGATVQEKAAKLVDALLAEKVI